MKKTYNTPVIEKVDFDYKNQVVASKCGWIVGRVDDPYCKDDVYQKFNG